MLVNGPRCAFLLPFYHYLSVYRMHTLVSISFNATCPSHHLSEAVASLVVAVPEVASVLVHHHRVTLGSWESVGAVDAALPCQVPVQAPLDELVLERCPGWNADVTAFPHNAVLRVPVRIHGIGVVRVPVAELRDVTRDEKVLQQCQSGNTRVMSCDQDWLWIGLTSPQAVSL